MDDLKLRADSQRDDVFGIVGRRQI
jgi:hypothetical protein